MEKRVSLNVLFYIKRTKLLKNGEAPIYVRISINRSRTEFAINRSIDPKLWSSEAGCAKGFGKAARHINNYLESIRYNLYNQITILREEGSDVTAKLIKNKFLGIEEAPVTILNTVYDYIKKTESLIGIDYAEGTIKQYRTTYKHLEAFLTREYRNPGMRLEEMDHAFVSSFELYLKTVVGIAHNTAMKYLKKLKKICREQLASGELQKDPFANYKMTEKKVDRDFLTEEELQRLITKDFELDRLDQVKDCFLVSCFTGLAYSDLKRLTNDNLFIGQDGKKWISIHRKKLISKAESQYCQLLKN